LFARYWQPRHWPTWIGLGFMRLVGLLPLPLIALVGQGCGLLLYALHGSRRRITHRNLERCFPELPVHAHRRLARAHFRALGQTLLDNAIAWWGSARRLRRLVRVNGREHLETALNGGNVILLAPHFVGLEIGGVRLSLEHPTVTVFRHPDNKLLRAVMERQRARFGLKLIEHNKPFTALVRAVKSGAPLYYLPDQDAGRRHAVFAPFFGIPAATFTALGRLARMTSAKVILCVTHQRRFGLGYVTELYPPLENFPSDDEAADTARMNAVIEQAARRWPAQYFWVHKRFKTRPEGEPDFYR
jgi:KDO2-lipid IV(A) lauroyltransferase